MKCQKEVKGGERTQDWKLIQKTKKKNLTKNEIFKIKEMLRYLYRSTRLKIFISMCFKYSRSILCCSPIAHLTFSVTHL